MNNTITMEQKNKLVPELRFTEFVNDGEWKQESIEKVLIESRIPSIENDVNKRITVRLNLKGIEKREVRGTETENGTYFFQRKKGQFIYGKQNLHKGAFGLVPAELDGYESSQDIPSFDFNDKFYPEFFVQYLSQENIYTQLEKISTGTGSKRIYPKDFYKVKYPFPHSIIEQQKIADCLTSLDELITEHTDKLETLKNHKKGLLQNLFPQQDQRVPNYRFPEFLNDGEWEEKKLEDLAKRGSGHTPNKQMSNYYDGGIKWVSLADSNKLDNGFIYETKIEISKEGIENSSAVIHPAGTVILSRDAGVGKSAILYSPMAVSQHFIVWTCDNNSKLYNWYLYYVLQLLKPAFESIAVGSTIKTIGLPYFKELVILVPSIKEQQKIASCIYSLDELITEQYQNIKHLTTHKKGLMQGLFPKIY